jgi:hypothetical protein
VNKLRFFSEKGLLVNSDRDMGNKALPATPHFSRSFLLMALLNISEDGKFADRPDNSP